MNINMNGANDSVITSWYQGLLGRNPTAPEYDYWNDKITKIGSPSWAWTAFANDTSIRNEMASNINALFVANSFDGRSATQLEIDKYVGASINQTGWLKQKELILAGLAAEKAARPVAPAPVAVPVVVSPAAVITASVVTEQPAAVTAAAASDATTAEHQAVPAAAASTPTTTNSLIYVAGAALLFFLYNNMSKRKVR